MSIHLLHKNTFRPGYIPQPDDLVIGQLGLTIHTGEVALWTKDSANNIVQLSGGGGGSGAAVYNGMLTVLASDGSLVGEFTANQSGPTTVTLPQGFSGDYEDLANKPTIGDGALTIKTAEGQLLGEFTANQTTTTEVVLPAAAAGEAGGRCLFYGEAPPKGVAFAAGDLFTQENTLCQYVWTGSTWAGVTPAFTAVPGENADLSRFYLSDQYIQVQPQLPEK